MNARDPYETERRAALEMAAHEPDEIDEMLGWDREAQVVLGWTFIVGCVCGGILALLMLI